LSPITETSRIDGKRIAAEVRAGVARWAAALAGRGVVPGLAVVLVGDDPASQVYVRNKDKAAREAGFAVRTLRPEAHIWGSARSPGCTGSWCSSRCRATWTPRE
jgi:5,10-methylene-tetrahydrofolate dehydrogenase/methenyl tetrahydrofolate cyclohydrolase